MGGQGTGVAAELDWEIKDLTEVEAETGADGAVATAPPRRLLCITLPKRPPAPGVVVWWQGVLSGHPTIDLNGLEDRDTAKQTVFQQNWNTAHRQFKNWAAYFGGYKPAASIIHTCGSIGSALSVSAVHATGGRVLLGCCRVLSGPSTASPRCGS